MWGGESNPGAAEQLLPQVVVCGTAESVRTQAELSLARTHPRTSCNPWHGKQQQLPRARSNTLVRSRAGAVGAEQTPNRPGKLCRTFPRCGIEGR